MLDQFLSFFKPIFAVAEVIYLESTWKKALVEYSLFCLLIITFKNTKIKYFLSNMPRQKMF